MNIELDWADLTMIKTGLDMLLLDGIRDEDPAYPHIAELRGRITKSQDDAWVEPEYEGGGDD